MDCYLLKVTTNPESGEKFTTLMSIGGDSMRFASVPTDVSNDILEKIEKVLKGEL